MNCRCTITKYSCFKIFTPQGDGNSHTQHRLLGGNLFVSKYLPRKGTETGFTTLFLLVVAVSKYLPRKGTETYWHCNEDYEHKVSKYLPRKGTETSGKSAKLIQQFQNIYPARGRKPLRNHHRGGLQVSKYLPRKGTETRWLQLTKQNSRVSKYLPRKGTETSSFVLNSSEYSGFKIFTPQGDGNFVNDHVVVLKLRQFQNIYPARGRKHLADLLNWWYQMVSKYLARKGTETRFIYRALNVKVSKYLPRKGTETRLPHYLFSRHLFQNIYPARGRKPSRQGLGKTYLFQNIYPARGRKPDGAI